eukprot:7237356-Prymnesium_polylepis.2
MLSSLGACAVTHLGRGPLRQRPGDRPAVDTSEHGSLPHCKPLPHARCTGKYGSHNLRRCRQARAPAPVSGCMNGSCNMHEWLV